MKRQRNRRGFTLAETLAALVIVVLLAMSVQMGTMTALLIGFANSFAKTTFLANPGSKKNFPLIPNN